MEITTDVLVNEILPQLDLTSFLAYHIINKINYQQSRSPTVWRSYLSHLDHSQLNNLLIRLSQQNAERFLLVYQQLSPSGQLVDLRQIEELYFMMAKHRHPELCELLYQELTKNSKQFQKNLTNKVIELFDEVEQSLIPLFQQYVVGQSFDELVAVAKKFEELSEKFKGKYLARHLLEQVKGVDLLHIRQSMWSIEDDDRQPNYSDDQLSLRDPLSKFEHNLLKAAIRMNDRAVLKVAKALHEAGVMAGEKTVVSILIEHGSWQLFLELGFEETDLETFLYIPQDREMFIKLLKIQSLHLLNGFRCLSPEEWMVVIDDHLKKKYEGDKYQEQKNGYYIEAAKRARKFGYQHWSKVIIASSYYQSIKNLKK